MVMWLVLLIAVLLIIFIMDGHFDEFVFFMLLGIIKWFIADFEWIVLSVDELMFTILAILALETMF